MKSMWIKTIMTLAVGLSVAACGKSKSTSSVVPDRTVKAPESAEKKGELPPPKESPEVTTDPQVDLKGNRVNHRHNNPPDGIHTKPGGNGNPQGNSQPNTDSTPTPNSGSTPAPNSPPNSDPNPNLNSNPGPSANNGSNPGTDSSLDPEENDSILSDADENVMIDESKRYSGAASDSLREYLTAKQESLPDEGQKFRNLKLAYSIAGVQMKLIPQTGRVKITLYLGKDKKAVTLDGVLNSNKRTALTSETPGLKAAMTCLDDGPTCETRVISIGYEGANVPVIYRRSNLSLDAKFQDRRCLTGECEEFYTIFRRTEMKLMDSLTLKYAKMDSYEVIQGRSAFKLIAVTNGGEVFKVAGPLANPARYPQLNTPADRRLTTDEMTDPTTGRLLHTCLNDALNDVRIVSNSGRGNVNLMVKMKMLSNGERDSFQLTLNRKIAPLRAQIESEASGLVLP